MLNNIKDYINNISHYLLCEDKYYLTKQNPNLKKGTRQIINFDCLSKTPLLRKKHVVNSAR